MPARRRGLCAAAMAAAAAGLAASAAAFLVPAGGARAPAPPMLRASASAGTASRVGATGNGMAAAGAMMALAGAVALRRTVRTERSVTVEEIETLTTKQIPDWFRTKISIGMARRAQRVMAMKKALDEDVMFITAFNNDGMTFHELDKARLTFPESVQVRGFRNTQMIKAMKGTKWEAFGKKIKGPCIYVMCMNEDDVRPAVEAMMAIEKDFFREERLAQINEPFREAGEPFYDQHCLGGIFKGEWKYMDGEQVAKLKDAPTKKELIAMIAGGIKAVTQKIAVGIKQNPQKIAIGTKKIVEKMEEDGKDTVGDVVA